MKKIVTVAVTLLLLVIVSGGCETKEQKAARELQEEQAQELAREIAHTNEMKEKARRIKRGDSKEDVIRWLGQPDEINSKGSNVGIVTAYWYPRQGVAIGFIFDYNRVMSGVLTDILDPDPDADNDGSVWLIAP